MTQTYPSNALPVGSMIQEFQVEDVLGVGSFGIVYRARNIYFDEVVAIKEFLPSQLARRLDSSTVRPSSVENRAVYEWGIKKFVNEAKLLWELSQPAPHRSIICVSRFHEANGTAYMVMDYEKGEALSDWLRRSNTLTQAELEQVLYPLLEGLELVHAKEVFHRDIKPPNILVRPDGSPVLIDFGAARWQAANDGSSLVSILTPEYAAPEQSYAGGEIGPWTDIYALAATAYRAITGNTPAPASERVLTGKYDAARDAQTNGAYSAGFLDAVDLGLELRPQERPQSAAEWRALLERKSVPAPRPENDATVIQVRSDMPAHAMPHNESRPAAYDASQRRSSPLAETQVHPSMAATQASAVSTPTRATSPQPRTQLAARMRASRGPVGVSAVVLAAAAVVGIAWYLNQQPADSGADEPVADGADNKVDELVAQLKLPPASGNTPSDDAKVPGTAGPDPVKIEVTEDSAGVVVGVPTPAAGPVAQGADEGTVSVTPAGPTSEVAGPAPSAPGVQPDGAPPGSEAAAQASTNGSSDGGEAGSPAQQQPGGPEPQGADARDALIASLQLKPSGTPESGPVQTLDRDAVMSEVRGVIDAMVCQSLDLAWPAGESMPLSVEGFVAGEADLAQLRTALDRHAPDGLDYELSGVVTVAEPFCQTLELLATQAHLRDAVRARPVIEPNQPSRQYAEGQPIKATLEAPMDGFLYLDYIGPDGSVYHLLPSEEHPDNAMTAGQRIVVGENDDYEASEPHGQNLLVVIATPQPLFSQARPFSERLDAYQGALEQALAGPNARGVATSAYTMIVTRAKQ